MSKPMRLLIYSHDTFGLGHLRRSLLVASRVLEEGDASSVLIATGSPLVRSFKAPEGCDFLKLPRVEKNPDGSYGAADLRLSLEEILRLRTAILQATVETFRPHIFLVDHAPAGVEGEVRPVLEALADSPCRPRIVLGMRDIIDDVAAVRREWKRLGVWPLLDRVYDRILVYGDPQVLSTAHELGLAARFPAKIRWTGYLSRGTSPRKSSSAADEEPTVLVTAGGGGDGAPMIHAYLDALERMNGSTPVKSLIVAGPFVSHAEIKRMRERAKQTVKPVEVIRFTPRLDRLMGEVSGVVSMGGYNSMVEILSAGVPAFIVPRTRPRLEQHLRAARLARFVELDVNPLGEELPDRLGVFLKRVAVAAPRKEAPLLLNGLETVAEELQTLAGAMLGCGKGE